MKAFASVIFPTKAYRGSEALNSLEPDAFLTDMRVSKGM